MKIIHSKNILLATILMMFLFTACSHKVMFQNSTVVPAARGNVKVTRDSNKNYVIKIELTDLAEVKRLQPPKQTYIVWMVSDDAITKNIGQIKSSSSLLSSRLRVNFETVSSIKPTKIFITAEDDANVQFYGNPIILSTNNF